MTAKTDLLPGFAKREKTRKITLVLGCGCRVKADDRGYKIGAFVFCPNCGAGMRIDDIEREKGAGQEVEE